MVQVEFGIDMNEVGPWAPYLHYQTKFSMGKGEERRFQDWKPYMLPMAQSPYGESWIGRGKDLFYLSCEEYSAELEEGVMVAVKLEATLPGTSTLIESEVSEIELKCNFPPGFKDKAERDRVRLAREKAAYKQLEELRAEQRREERQREQKEAELKRAQYDAINEHIQDSQGDGTAPTEDESADGLRPALRPPLGMVFFFAFIALGLGIFAFRKDKEPRP